MDRDRNIILSDTNKKRRGILVVFVIMGLSSMGLWWWGNRDNPEVAQGWWGGVKISYQFEEEGKVAGVKNDKEVVDRLMEVLKDQKGKHAVYVYNLESKQETAVNANEVLPAMSLMKVPIMIATYKAIENGELKIDSLFDYPVEVVDLEASPSATPKIEIRKMSVRAMMKEMGYRSDNTAPVVLTKALGKQKMRDVLKMLEMTSSDFDANTTTATDIATMWRILAEGGVITDEHRMELYDFLQGSIYEDRITAGVPQGTKVVHKVGQDVDVWADSGIVMPECKDQNAKCKGNFVIVIMNDEVDVEAAKVYVPEVVRVIWQDQE